MIITITIDRSEVFASLMRTTGYIGAKQIDADDKAYRRIGLTEDDASLLARFWQECRDKLCLALRRLLEAEGLEGDTYRMDLCLSESFDTSLADALQSSVSDYFAQGIAARWLSITDKASAAEYAAAAASTLDSITRNAYCKRRPQRPHYH